MRDYPPVRVVKESAKKYMYLPQSKNFLDKREHFAGKKAIKTYTKGNQKKSRKNLEKEDLRSLK